MEDYLGLNTWFTQKAMARILGTSQQNISAHVRNILRENPSYDRIFVRKSRGRGGIFEKDNDLGRNYYHEIILELAAGRIRTQESAEFLLSIQELSRKKRGRRGFKMRQIVQ
jgi:hypothetical protein